MKETTYPSWGYTIQHGATTIWERWNGYTEEKGFETPSMNSFNHYSLGACVEWLYSHVLGIKLSESGDVCIAPALSPEITYAKGEYNSCHGKFCVDWKYADGRYYITVSADANVHFGYNFGEKNVLSVQMDNGVLCAVVE
jgi:alpha-L-rhamnosidase